MREKLYYDHMLMSTQNDSILYNFGLLLVDEQFNDRVISYSHILHETSPSLYILGKKSYPHITVLQFQDQRTNAELLWNQLKNLTHNEFDLHFRGLGVDFWNDWSCIWLKVRRTKILENLQAQALSILGDRSYLNGIGENYDPHLTLGAWPQQKSLPAMPIDLSIFNMGPVKARLALGRSGPNYQFEEVLFLGQQG